MSRQLNDEQRHKRLISNIPEPPKTQVFYPAAFASFRLLR